MGLEIERKFLVRDDSYARLATRIIEIRQGYLSVEPRHTVRVRLWQCGDDHRGYLTVKGMNNGEIRAEFEYEIPYDDAVLIYDMCSLVIHKVRHVVPWEGLTWEVDRFLDRHEGLTVAEVELPDEDTEVVLPPFIGQEVTDDSRYYNSNMAINCSTG